MLETVSFPDVQILSRQGQIAICVLAQDPTRELRHLGKSLSFV